jgi:protein-tyrosine-phosphatase
MKPSEDPIHTTYNILFVCTGNTCRSPMAEAVALQQLRERGWQHVAAGSAGVAADIGAPASAQAVEVADRRDLDLRAHRSRPLTPDLVAWADLILAMSPTQLGAIARLGGDHKMALLGDFARGEEGSGTPVSDPFGGSVAVYEATMAQLAALVSDSLDRLTPILQP